MATIKGNNSTGVVKALCISKDKGTKKQSTDMVRFRKNFGIINDAHGGSFRQVSLLAEESIEKIKAQGLALSYGDFAENIVTQGIELKNLPVGTKIKLGKNVILQISEIGKICHSRCAIYYKIGDCVMPKEGVFAKVLKGGVVNVGAKIKVLC